MSDLVPEEALKLAIGMVWRYEDDPVNDIDDEDDLKELLEKVAPLIIAAFAKRTSDVLIDKRDSVPTGRSPSTDGRRWGLEEAAGIVRRLGEPPQ